MRKALRYLTLLTTSGLLAAAVSTTSAVAAPAADAAWIEKTIEQMQRRDGVARVDMERFSETLMRAFQLGEPGDYFNNHSPSAVGQLAGIYGQAELAAALGQWTLSEPSADPRTPQSSSSGIRATQAAAYGTQGLAAPAPAQAYRPTGSTMISDSDFVAQTVGRMQNREPLSQGDTNRFQSIVKSGAAQGVIDQYGKSGIAELADIYGLNEIGRSLRAQEQVAAGSKSAAARISAVTSAPENTGDYRDEYLAKANSYDVVGVSRYGGAMLTVYSEDLQPYTLDDPIAGAQIRNNVTSCLYHGSSPSESTPRATNTMQLLDLPGEITAERFVRARNDDDNDVIETYHLSRVALDWGEASSSRVSPHFYGYLMPPPRLEYDLNGRERWIQPPPPPPEWHSFACSPRVIRS